MGMLPLVPAEAYGRLVAGKLGKSAELFWLNWL